MGDTPTAVPGIPDQDPNPAAAGLSGTAPQPPTPQAPAPQPEGGGSIISSILHAVGDALGGPKNNEHGQPISTGGRVLHGIGTIAQGVAAGAAQHGPGSIGASGLAGAQVVQKQAQQQKENTLANEKQDQEQLMNKATIAYHNNQMLLQQRDADRMDKELTSRIGESNRAFEVMAQEKGWQKPPILVNGKDVNGTPGNEADMMKFYSDPANHKAPDGYTYAYLPTTDDAGKASHAVYLAPINSMDQPVTLSKAEYKAQTGIEAPGTNFSLKLGDLISQRASFVKSSLEGAQEQRAEQQQKSAEKLLPSQIRHTEAETENLRAEAEQHRAEAKALGTAQLDTPDVTGYKPDLPAGGIKEYNKRADSFKKNIDQIAQTEGTYQQFSEILNDINSGKDLTGAQSVVALFNAIGISAEPLRGKGMRVNNTTVEHHENARSFGQDLYQKWLSLKNGDIITPQQVKDYATIASQVRTNQYVNLINQMHADGVKADPVVKMLRGNDRVADDGTVKIFIAASGGDPAKGAALAHSMGWK